VRIGRRHPVAGLVAAERLVRGERLAADGARVEEEAVRDVAAAAREHDEAQRQVLVLGGLPRHLLPTPPAGPRPAPLGPPRLLHRHARTIDAFLA
jgi:hypothetical protein